jgi:CP family cyanate transporter-like MFS transporter
LVGVVLVSLNLRPAIASVPPLADLIAADLRVGATALGALTALPVVCMGLFAPVGALAARRYGTARVVTAAVVLVAVGTALRAFGTLPVLYGSTILAGVGIAVAGALLPPLVRARFPERIAPVTGLYTTALIGGALLASALAEPSRLWFGGSWPYALAVWALAALVALAVWPFVAGRAPATGPAPAAYSRMPWRDGRVWAATLYMGGQSLLFYATIAWLAPRYTAVGATPAEGGLLLAVFNAAQLLPAFVVPALTQWVGRRPLVLAAGLVAITMFTAIAVVPADGWVWATLLGVTAGAQLALALTILGGLGETPADTAAASGMAFFVGYLLASLGPVLIGALLDLTGGYRVPFLTLAALATATLTAGLTAVKGRSPY